MNLIDRPRRLRQSKAIRDAVAETSIELDRLIHPLFVCEGANVKKPNPHLNTSFTLSHEMALAEVDQLSRRGIKTVLLFGVSSKRDPRGSEALNPDSAVVKLIKNIREKFPNVTVATDIALDPYTDHGHDGLFIDGEIPNDESIEVLCKMALLHAKSGAHIVAPSDMMDGRVGAIREALDICNHTQVAILAYTAKYASALYGPFRDTLGAQVQGDKKAYQMDPRNRREALRELELDLAEGADIVMVKPAIHYLDVISDFKAQSNVPVAAYHVSGEAAMIEAAAKAGIVDRDRAILEATHSIFRAGADLVATYFAEDIARLAQAR